MAWASFSIFSRGRKTDRKLYTEVPTHADVEGDVPHEILLNDPATTPLRSYHSVPDYILAISTIFLIVASVASVADKWHAVTDTQCDSMMRAFSEYPISIRILF